MHVTNLSVLISCQYCQIKAEVPEKTKKKRGGLKRVSAEVDDLSFKDVLCMCFCFWYLSVVLKHKMFPGCEVELSEACQEWHIVRGCKTEYLQYISGVHAILWPLKTSSKCFNLHIQVPFFCIFCLQLLVMAFISQNVQYHIHHGQINSWITPSVCACSCPDVKERTTRSFSVDGVSNYTSLHLSKEDNMLYLGAREILFALNLTDISAVKLQRNVRAKHL